MGKRQGNHTNMIVGKSVSGLFYFAKVEKKPL